MFTKWHLALQFSEGVYNVLKYDENICGIIALKSCCIDIAKTVAYNIHISDISRGGIGHGNYKHNNANR